MNNFLLLLGILFVPNANAGGIDKIQVNPDTHLFVDGNGQTRIFHGISQVNKNADINGGLITYTDTQLKQLKDWGFKGIRLGILWNAYEVAPNVFNESYLDGIENITNYYYKYGIMTILDMHQDCWSTLYCDGHGIPEFYSYPINDTSYWMNGIKTYPEPIFPPNGYVNDSYSNVFGKVDSETCHNVIYNTTAGWAASYNTYAISSAAQNLYDNKDFILDKFANNFWYKVANRFKDNPGILGYELINEPWIGDWYTYKELYIPGMCDKINLSRMYKHLNDVIRSIDNDTIIFYEPCTGGNDLDATPVGFNTGPGGNEYNTKQSLSYHIYCPFVQSDVPFNGSWLKNETIQACYELNGLQLNIRINDTNKLNTAGYLTEFGAIYYDELGYEEIIFMMNECDHNLISWAYWYLTPSGDINSPNKEVPYVTRTYAYQIASQNIVTMYFDQYSKNFTLSYYMDVNQFDRNMTTRIYWSKQFQYINGIQYDVIPNGYVNVIIMENGNDIILIPLKNPDNPNILLTFNLWAK